LKNERAEELDEYAVLKNKLDKYFLPKKNKHHARYTFLRMKQERGEKIGSYVSRLRDKANDCEFGEIMEERILEQCIQSVDNKELIRKAISKGWELDKFIEEAAQIEGTNLQMKEMKIEEHGAVYKVQNNTNRRQDYRQRPALERHLQLSNATYIMKEEDAQRMGKTVDRVGKRTILRQGVEQDTNRMINKIKEV
jgi:hypothetical protein